MMKRMRRAYFLLLLILTFLVMNVGQFAFSASVQIAPQLALMASDSRQIFGSYGASASAIISGFQRSDVNKFLMIGIGPESVSRAYQTAVSYTGQYSEDLCTIENLPQQARHHSPIDNNKAYLRQVRAMKNCIQMRVKDVGASRLQLPREQPNCVVRSLDDSTAIGQGGYCFFGILPASAFEVQLQVNPQCSTPQFLESQGISPQDFFAGIGFYVAGDASGYSMDLEMIEGSRLRLTLEASGQVFPVSLNYGNNVPLWPTRIAPDIHMGNVRVLPAARDFADEAPVVDSSIYVRNTCLARCRLGLCESECDYALAIGAQMRLYQLQQGGKKRLIDMWYAGGVAPSQWTGLIPSSRRVNFGPLAYGERYRLLANLDYPSMYYELLVGNFSQNLIDLKSFSTNAARSGRALPALGGLAGVGSTPNNLPSVGSMPTLGGGAVNLGSPLQSALATLQSMFKVSDWPPYYESFCSDEHCLSLRSGSAQSEVGMDFDLAGLRENGEATLKNIVVWRNSNVMSKYEEQLSAPPSVRCGW
jgi:hypothetical protein